MLMFQVLSIIAEPSVRSILYLQSSIFLLSTDFLPSRKKDYSKNDTINIEKNIYIYIINWFFF